MRLYQVRILTDDFARSFRFYSEALGLRVAWGDIRGPYAAFGPGRRANIAIFERAGMREAGFDVAAMPAPGQGGGSAMVVLEVGSVDEVYDMLRRRGFSFENTPRDYPDWTIRAVHLRDPDGVLVEFFEPLPEERWTAWARAKNAQAPGAG